MALTSSYLITVKNLGAFFDSLITAKAPSAFTNKFIQGLGFKSTNDRLYISLLKGLGFLDASAVPTERYFRFLDQSESKRVLAEATEDAYGDLFALNTTANELTIAEIKNKLRSLTEGRYSDKVISLMATTFKALCDYAEWSPKKVAIPIAKDKTPEATKSEQKPIDTPVLPVSESPEVSERATGLSQLHYNIQVHLPESRDESVYDAIFKSLRRHLL